MMNRQPPRKRTFYIYKRVIICLLVVLIAAPWGGVDGARAQTAAMQVGVAVTDITPPVGYPQYRGESTGVHDALHAKAIVFQQGHQQAALVVCDLIAITRGLSSEVRSLASRQTGIPFSHIAITATHTHTGPAYRDAMEEYMRKKKAGTLTEDEKDSYPARLTRNVTQAIVDAAAAVHPVQLQVGSGEAHGLSFNRRFLMADGTVEFNPGVQNPDIVRPVGPIDSDVYFLLVRDAESGAPQAGLTVFALHTDTVGGTDFSADYPYYLARALKEEWGEGFVSVFGQGTSGDINHVDVTSEEEQGGHEATTKPTGQTLAAIVKDELPNLEEVEVPNLAVRMEMVYAPLQEYTEEELAWAKSDSDAPVYPENEFLQRTRRMKILSLEQMRKTGKAIPPTIGTEPWTLPLEVQVLRLGDETAIVTLPGEVFVELGLAIKAASPFEHTMVIELAHLNIAYVPTREAFRQGSYETINSRIAPGGGEMMMEAAVRMLKELDEGLR